MSYYPGYSPSTVLTQVTTSTPTSTKTSTSSSTSTSTSKSSDSSTSTSSSSSVIPVLITPTTSSSSPTSSSTNPVSQPAQSSSTPGLSTGAKAGIGVGAALGGCILLGLICCLAFCIRRRKLRREEAAVRPRPEMAATDKDPFDHHSQAWSGTMSELPGDGRNSNSVTSPASIQHSWSRPLSEVEGSSIPTYQSMASLQSQEFAESRPGYQPYRRAEVPPTGVQGVGTSSTASYTPGRHVDDGVYEMPAQLPGSTLPWR
jgi:hypothetical protein